MAAKNAAEEKRRGELARERERLQNDADALFGANSFVKASASASSPKPPTSASSSASTKSGTTFSTTNPIAKTTTPASSAAKSKSGVPAKKTAAPVEFWPLGKPANFKASPAPEKSASAAQGAPKKTSSPSPAASKPSTFTPPPLPDIKYIDPSKHDVLPTVAELRAGIRQKPASSRSDLLPDSSSGFGPGSSSDKRNLRIDSQDKDLDDFVVSDEEEGDGVGSNRGEAARLANKKRKAEVEKEDLWAQLRAITRYNPNSAKYQARDRMSISVASSDDIQHEERQSALIAQQEDKAEEAALRRHAEEKQRRRREWRRKQGLPSDESDSEDDNISDDE